MDCRDVLGRVLKFAMCPQIVYVCKKWYELILEIFARGFMCGHILARIHDIPPISFDYFDNKTRHDIYNVLRFITVSNCRGTTVLLNIKPKYRVHSWFDIKLGHPPNVKSYFKRSFQNYESFRYHIHSNYVALHQFSTENLYVTQRPATINHILKKAYKYIYARVRLRKKLITECDIMAKK